MHRILFNRARPLLNPALLLNRALLLGLLFSFAASARAQFAVYGKFDLTHQSDVTFAGNASASQTLYGGGGGFYDDFLHAGPIHLGTDVRADFVRGGNYQYRSFLGGIRLAVKPPVLPVRPYVQFSVGVGGTAYSGAHSLSLSNLPYDNKLLYEVLGGIDFTLLPHVDFRAVEIGVGHQTAVNAGAPPDTLVLVSSGLVLRF